MKDPFKVTETPQVETPSLIVSWAEDAGRVGPKVMEYLLKKIKCRSFCEIEPGPFFSFGGVSVENNVAQFPEGRFYFCDRGDLVFFRGHEPQFQRYAYLNALLDVAEHYCHVREILTLSGTISTQAHTAERRVSVVYNHPQLRKMTADFDLQNMTWQGPPAVNSFLIWAAARRKIPAASLWPEIPFYISACEDASAVKRLLTFLVQRFGLTLDLGEIDETIRTQEETLSSLREEDPEINHSIALLESDLTLGEEEQVELAKKVTERLGQMG